MYFGIGITNSVIWLVCREAILGLLVSTRFQWLVIVIISFASH